MNSKINVMGMLVTSMLIITCTVNRYASQQTDVKPAVNANPSPAYLSPQESLRSMYLPTGFHLELVASEPMISEPVAMVWDGNGRMYVAEMNTYMQNINGSGQTDPICKIKRLEDTNGDGKMDKQTVYIDSLVLPRMMLCVGDELIVNETFTYNLWAYRDSNGDGKADSRRQVYKNDKRDTRNMEHQNSGLIWNLDNWLYVGRDAVRFKYSKGSITADTLTTVAGQWGMTSDDYGRLFYSNAGGEVPAEAFQVNIAYGRVEFKDHFKGDFVSVWPIIATPDVQGGMKRLRPDTTLNHFTASNGQSIFRGDRLPADVSGDLFICEPVGRLIRRAKVSHVAGKTLLENAYQEREFLASTDMNFRPVNTATGPDGCLYIVDMNRGIIQEKQFINEFLLPRILKKGLEKNIGNGRIYRLVHDGYKRGPQPALLNETSAMLVTRLSHPNGWWRDNAQKELITRGDRSVIPALTALALNKPDAGSKQPGHLARIHALWTLEGLDAISKDLLFAAFKDEHPEVRKAAVWISEGFIRNNDKQLLAKLAELRTDPSYDVLAQLVLSLSYSQNERAAALSDGILKDHPENEMLSAIPKLLETASDTRKYGTKLALMSATDRRLLINGAAIYRQLCATCHGGDGKGISSNAAPPFVGSARVAGDKDKLVRILLNGLTGPIDGKTYEMMAPFGASNSDEWVASVLSYIRSDFGNLKAGAAIVNPAEVKALRAVTATRERPWTLKELENLGR